MNRMISVVRTYLATAAFLIALGGPMVMANTAHAEDHTRIMPREQLYGRDGHSVEHREFRRGPSVGLFYGAPGVVVPPPVYYGYADPSYAYAPVPVSGVYATAYGYCQDYQTNVGIQTACQGADGVWRYIN